MSRRNRWRNHMGRNRVAVTLWGLFALALVVGLVDSASIAISRVMVDDDARTAARAAVRAAAGHQVNQATAEVAYRAAEHVMDTTVTIRKDDFRLNRDGSVTLTAQSMAPTLMARYVGPLRDYTRVSSTLTQSNLGY